MADRIKDMIRINRVVTDGGKGEFVEIEITDVHFREIYRGIMSLDEYARCTVNGGCTFCSIVREEALKDGVEVAE